MKLSIPVLIICGLFLPPVFARDLGLPEVPIPENNPQTPAKIALGDKLFHDTKFSSTGEVSCATCHESAKGFTDSPLVTSRGVNNQTGTRNAPTVLNAAFNKTQFWDGRSPSLEDQSQHPFVNPVEMGLVDHQSILETVNGDDNYIAAFKEVFGTNAGDITMDHVTLAIASFERTVVAGDSPWDRWYLPARKMRSTKRPGAVSRFFWSRGVAFPAM